MSSSEARGTSGAAGAAEVILTDAVLVERAVAGDAAAFAGLVRRHLRTAHAAAWYILRDLTDAEDVCQDAFFAAHRNLHRCKPAANFRPWFLQIVRRRALDVRRSRRVREARPLGAGAGEVDVPAPSRQGPAARTDQSTLRERLYAALVTLPVTCRRVVLLHDVHGWKHREIAERLGCGVSTSRAHLWYARKGLRERLGMGLLEELDLRAVAS